jgi:hypothetical protein
VGRPVGSGAEVIEIDISPEFGSDLMLATGHPKPSRHIGQSILLNVDTVVTRQRVWDDIREGPNL